MTDEVWYDRHSQRFFTATALDTTGRFVTGIPTAPFAHSVAVDPCTGHVFVPMGQVGIEVFEPVP